MWFGVVCIPIENQPRSQALSSLPPLVVTEVEKREPGNEVDRKRVRVVHSGQNVLYLTGTRPITNFEHCDEAKPHAIC